MGKYTKTTKTEKNCSHCGDVFVAVRESNYACSAACRDLTISRAKKEARKATAEPLPPKPCQQCGVIYAPVTSKSRFCSEPCQQRAKTIRNRGEGFVEGKRMSLRGRAQSEDHVKKRAESRRISLSNTTRSCVKCGDGFTPTQAAQKYCSGRCWQSVERRRRPKDGRISIHASVYAQMLEAQDRKCKICGVEGGANNRGDKLAVDHCHASGRIRGLLCHKCNTALGLFKDNPENLAAAIRYLAA